MAAVRYQDTGYGISSLAAVDADIFGGFEVHTKQQFSAFWLPATRLPVEFLTIHFSAETQSIFQRRRCQLQ